MNPIGLNEVSEKIFSDHQFNQPPIAESDSIAEEIDFLSLQRDVEKKISEAIAAERYEETLPLYDDLLNLRIQELKKQNEKLGIESFEIFKLEIESEMAQAESYYLLLSGQPRKVIELCTPLIQRMQSSEANGLLFKDRELLQIRAAAYLMDGEEDLGKKDLKESNKIIELSGLGAVFPRNSRFEDLSNIIFLKVLEKKLGASFVEMETVSLEELNQMADWEKADYFLANEQPSEALKWVGNDAERRAIALAQLSRFEEAMELLEDDFEPQTAALICFMQSDLESAKDLAEDIDNFPLLSMIVFLHSS